jgi:hypothetical protein
MSSDRELTHIVRSWMEEGATVLPDRVLDDVLAQLPVTSQRRPWWRAWRTQLMNGTLKFAAVAVALVAVAAIGLAVYFSRPLGPAATQSPGLSPAVTVALPTQPAVVPATDSPTDQTLTPQPTSTGDKAPWVVFQRGDGRFGTPDDLWAMRTDGSAAQEILSGLLFANIAWSQDGSRLLVADVDASGISRVYLSEVSDDIGPFVDTGFGTGAETACNDKSGKPFPCQDYPFSFAPDGERVVFKQRCTYYIPGCDFLTILDLRTGERTELSETLEHGIHHGPIGDPAWSPDGSSIAFVRETRQGVAGVVAESNLYLINADGTNLHKVDLPVSRVTSPQWSPDGTTLALMSDVYVGEEWQGADIYTVRVDGTNLRRLTTDGNSSLPEWTQSGQIRFRNGTDSQPSMSYSLMDADGGNLVELANIEGLLGALPPSGTVGEYDVPGYLWQSFLWQPAD